jgi:hypothetical protein
MSDQIITIRSIALAAPLLILGIGVAVPMHAARADDCLTSPKSTAPKGQHWYYHSDRANHRKCWFLRALDPSTQKAAEQSASTTAPATPASEAEKPATADADVSTTASIKAPPLPPPRPQSAPARTASTNEPTLQHGENAGTGSPKPEANAPQIVASSQPVVQAPAPATAIAWPNPPVVGTVEPPKPKLVESKTPDTAPPRAAPVAAVVDAPPSPASDGVERDSTPAVPSAKVVASSAGSVVEMLLVVAIGLVAGGLLYRLVMKISTTRGGPILTDRSVPDWVDDAALSLVPVVPVAGDDGTRRLYRASEARWNSARRNGKASRIADAASTHENRLAELIRDLDQMLQPRKGA